LPTPPLPRKNKCRAILTSGFDNTYRFIVLLIISKIPLNIP
jgi:hypothetical protein